MGRLNRLVLGDFRNYPQLDVEFVGGINLFLGPNGQGKTNLLEAIHYLSLLRSFRTTQLRTMARHSKQDFLVRAELEVDGHVQKLALQQGQQRRLLVERQPVSLASEFIGRLFCVTFVPEDIELVKGSAGDRRRYLDILASQLEPGYLQALQEYQKALKSRNALLRHPGDAAHRQIRAYDTVLAARAAQLVPVRRRLTIELQETLARLGPVAGRNGEQTIEYQGTLPELDGDPAPEALEERYRQALADNLQRDIMRQQTLRGPHRDDLRIALDGHLLGDYGSEGQCRLAVLALKMAAGELLMARRSAETVVWLVDDVVGELDAEARQVFFTCLRQAHQAFVVGTDESLIAELQPAAVFAVSAGQVTRRT